MATKEEMQEIETAAIGSFRKDLEELTKKHSVSVICFGTRHETEDFEIEGKETKMCAAFAASFMKKDSTIGELKAVDSAFDTVKESIIEPMHRDIVRKMLKKDGIDLPDLVKGLGDVLSKAFGKECECEECKKEAEEKKVVYKQDGDKICATFEDFVNLQESPAGFGDTEEEAKKDLLKNVSEK